MAEPPATLRRELGLFGATMMGLGSIVGTGVFVSIGIAAGSAGPAVVLAIALAAFVATCNALSSAQLAASHPVSGGTYEYGYLYLRPSLGFTAGWMFLCAKSASAATAALGFAGYFLSTAGLGESLRVPLALGTAAAFTAVVFFGIKRSNALNTAIVSVTLLALAALVLCALPAVLKAGAAPWTPFFDAWPDTPGGNLGGFLQATALMFVAFTGYGRIATLGEEVHEPRRTIPRAIVVTVIVSSLLYMAVGAAGIGAAGARPLAQAVIDQGAPLEAVAHGLGSGWLPALVAVGAMTAMLGVLLNLILGLSRVLLAMGRRRDMPSALAKVHERHATPHVAVLVVGVIVLGLVCIGNLRTTWSFSAFTVLIYSALTNLCALRMPPEKRLYPRALAWCGLGSCLFLAFWVDWQVWLAGLGLMIFGWWWHTVARVAARRLAADAGRQA
ncbi:MAG: amino acid permease [Planctomycetota bacterium]|nr:amino acid permease [Planctomycetota bacterium]